MPAVAVTLVVTAAAITTAAPLAECRTETTGCWNLSFALIEPAADCSKYYQGRVGPDRNLFANCTYNSETGKCARELGARNTPPAVCKERRVPGAESRACIAAHGPCGVGAAAAPWECCNNKVLSCVAVSDNRSQCEEETTDSSQ